MHLTDKPAEKVFDVKLSDSDFDDLNLEFKAFFEALCKRIGGEPKPGSDVQSMFIKYKIAQFDKRLEALEGKGRDEKIQL
jgi:hypothetical protein